MNPFRLQGLQQGQHILRYRAIVEQHGDDAALDLPAGDSIQAQAGILFTPLTSGGGVILHCSSLSVMPKFCQRPAPADIDVRQLVNHPFADPYPDHFA